MCLIGENLQISRHTASLSIRSTGFVVKSVFF